MHNNTSLYGILSGGGLWSQNMIPFYESPYYYINDVIAYSRGPDVWGSPPSYDSDTIYACLWENNNLIIRRVLYDNNDLTAEFGDMVEKIELPNHTKPTHISFSFDQNGFPIITWEEDFNRIFLRWYDTAQQSTTISEIGRGRTPYAILETFNGILQENRQVVLLYCTEDDRLVFRKQSSRYGVEEHILNNVHGILSVGHTPLNSTKVIFLKHEGGRNNWAYDTVSTKKLGLWIDERNIETSGLSASFNFNSFSIKSSSNYSEISTIHPKGRHFNVPEFGISVSTPTIYDEFLNKHILSTSGIRAEGLSISIRDSRFQIDFSEESKSLSFEMGMENFNSYGRLIENQQEDGTPGHGHGHSPLDHTMDVQSFNFFATRGMLDDLISSIKLNYPKEEDYTPETWLVLSNALINAEDVIDSNADKHAITNAFITLKEAESQLKLNGFSWKGDILWVGDIFWKS